MRPFCFMQIDRIKISQEINFNGMPTWIGIEAALLPGEDEKDGLRQIQKIITEYQQEEQKTYGKSNWAKQEQPKVSLMDELANCTTEEEILSFRLTIKSPEEQEFYNKILSELTNKK
jgi:hypothetical protein